MESQYIIIEANSTFSLQEAVNKKIKEGYQPMGGVDVKLESYHYPIRPNYKVEKCFQAMYKPKSTT